MWRSIILALIGVSLLLNPIYLYPNGGGIERTYSSVEIIDNETADDALIESNRAIECPGNRVCALEEEIQQNGSLEYDSIIQQDSPYSAININDGWYLITHTNSSGGVGLQLETTSAIKAADAVAVSVDEYPEDVISAIENGKHMVYGDRITGFERNPIVKYEGEIYLLTAGKTSTHWTEGYSLLIARFALSCLGLMFIFASLLWSERRSSG